MKKQQLERTLILSLAVFLLSACLSGAPAQNTPQPTATPTPEPLAPKEVILAYFDAINTKDFLKSFGYQWQNWTEMEKTRTAECFAEADITYSSIEIIPYAEVLETVDAQIQQTDQGDIAGQCDRFMVSYWADFPSDGDGEFSFMCTLVFDQDAWKIMESGSPTSDSCTRAIERLEKSKQD